jgi:type II secretory pathway pseudopilin PulG
MTTRRQCIDPGPKEGGFILLALVFVVALLTISLTIALPRVREEIQRDREIETMHRGAAYVRAIRLYYRKFHAYPPNIDALVMTNDIRFLRQRYTDPITGQDDWTPILVGQNKAPTAFGFFGEPIGFASATSTGLAPSANASSNPGGTDPVIGAAGSADANGNTLAASGGIASNQTFGGGGIIGISPATSKPSILVYKKMDRYNEWEFVYDPISDRMIGGMPPPQPPSTSPPNTGSPGFGPTPSGASSGGTASLSPGSQP